MVKLNAYLSNTQPAVQSGLWIKPVGNGFTVLLIGNGSVLPLIPSNTPSEAEDVATLINDAKSALIGKVQDNKSANTINGAKAYTKEQIKSVVGTNKDESTDMTLHGLKAYIDAQIAELEVE